MININSTHFEPMRSEDPSEQGPHIPPLVRKDVHPQGFEFYKKALTFFLENPPDVCAPARSTPRHLHRRQSHHRASPVSLFLINNFYHITLLFLT